MSEFENYEKERMENLKKMIKSGYTINQIVEETGLTEEEYKILEEYVNENKKRLRGKKVKANLVDYGVTDEQVQNETGWLNGEDKKDE